ncbi:MAG: response regulator [Lachnospiraceae bacterium]|nr:response regulator [Lachnospiraceae bacterium]
MKKILIVDDEGMNLMSTKFILSNAGYDIVTAESGEEGINILKNDGIDLLLLDVEMPNMNGIETLELIRQDEEIANTRVLFLTASTSQDDMSDAVHLGAKGFIKKPCLPDELIKSVEKTLAERSKPLILVVDDEPMNHMMIKMVFEDIYRVKCVSSGEDAITFVKNRIPDLIILDLNMPVMNGQETYENIRKVENCLNIPVVFITAEDDEDTELELFKAGAMEFIKKPFIPEIMRERIRRILELKKLQDFLNDEVSRKTSDLVESNNKVNRLFDQLVSALSGAIDAKDSYTNGHSNRVADYSKEIAIRMGKNEEEARNVYNIAMLHDVGKIGIPNDIINKPGRLSDEEFEVIKSHTVKGWKILENISEFPELAIGAHWHHERYDGKGYPDGLAGDAIPEIARIVCVADCYDAMSSNRSYRDALPQDVVRGEIEKGMGTQFDPVIAKHMLNMIDEDVNYDMREK